MLEACKIAEPGYWMSPFVTMPGKLPYAALHKNFLTS